RRPKEENLRMLLEPAEHAGIKSPLLEIADFIQDRVPCYRYPGKSAFSFSLQERNKEGRPRFRSYFTLWADRGRPELSYSRSLSAPKPRRRRPWENSLSA